MTNTKRVLAAILVLLAGFTPVIAEEIVTVGVFSSQEVLRTFYQDSDAYRAWIRERDAHEQTLDRELARLDAIQADRADAYERDQSRRVESLTAEYQAQVQYINDLLARWSVREEELTEELTNDVFWTRLWQSVEFVATNKGFTSVFDIDATETPTPFWYSPDVDVTEQVTAELISRYR